MLTRIASDLAEAVVQGLAIIAALTVLVVGGALAGARRWKR